MVNINGTAGENAVCSNLIHTWLYVERVKQEITRLRASRKFRP